MTGQLRTAQEWAQDYLKNRLGDIEQFLNQAKILTFADLKEGELFIRFPWFRIENGELVFKNTELYRKIWDVRQMSGSVGHYNAMKMVAGSLNEIPDNEPVIRVK